MSRICDVNCGPDQAVRFNRPYYKRSKLPLGKTLEQGYFGQVPSQVYNPKIQYTQLHYNLFKPNRKNCYQESTSTLWIHPVSLCDCVVNFVITADSYFQSSNHICSELRFSVGQRSLNTTLNLTCIIQGHLWSKHKCLSMNSRERRQSTNKEPGYRVRSLASPIYSFRQEWKTTNANGR